MTLGIILFLMAGIMSDPGTVQLQWNVSAVIYDTEKKEWTVPVYEETKHIIRCVERDRVQCLRGN